MLYAASVGAARQDLRGGDIQGLPADNDAHACIRMDVKPHMRNVDYEKRIHWNHLVLGLLMTYPRASSNHVTVADLHTISQI